MNKDNSSMSLIDWEGKKSELCDTCRWQNKKSVNYKVIRKKEKLK